MRFSLYLWLRPSLPLSPCPMDAIMSAPLAHQVEQTGHAPIASAESYGRAADYDDYDRLKYTRPTKKERDSSVGLYKSSKRCARESVVESVSKR